MVKIKQSKSLENKVKNPVWTVDSENDNVPRLIHFNFFSPISLIILFICSALFLESFFSPKSIHVSCHYFSFVFSLMPSRCEKYCRQLVLRNSHQVITLSINIYETKLFVGESSFVALKEEKKGKTCLNLFSKRNYVSSEIIKRFCVGSKVIDTKRDEIGRKKNEEKYRVINRKR